MDIGVISVRYARALVKSAIDQKLKEEKWQMDLIDRMLEDVSVN